MHDAKTNNELRYMQGEMLFFKGIIKKRLLVRTDGWVLHYSVLKLHKPNPPTKFEYEWEINSINSSISSCVGLTIFDVTTALIRNQNRSLSGGVSLQHKATISSWTTLFCTAHVDRN